MNRKLSKNVKDFINDEYLTRLIDETCEDRVKVKEILAKSLEKKPLNVEETAALLAAESPELAEEIFEAARKLKKMIYGPRIVLFAPLYIGNFCINDCIYCAFRKSLRSTVRKTLTDKEIMEQVEALLDKGHKRLILVYGEHPDYTADFIAKTVSIVYNTSKANSRIRRVNINAAPLDHDGYRIVKEAGIGTYQIFQETYHHETYRKVHPPNTCKADYLWRLDGLSRAYEAGCDDVGIGALFGLYNWKFEVLGLVSHASYLMKRFNCGPHTISFPRIKPAYGVKLDNSNFVSDYDFKRIVAILRLSVPYTGMILTARESPHIRQEVMKLGVSQIDAGTRIELGGYTQKIPSQEIDKEQFVIGDTRSLDEVVRELLENDYIPSFCTACYRIGRTGEHFMEFAIPGFIKKYCTRNALLTLEEYLVDYASEQTANIGRDVINKYVKQYKGEEKSSLETRLLKIRNTKNRDFYF